MTAEADKPTAPKPKSRRGGARPGAGRPSVAVQMERVDQAAQKAIEQYQDADPERALKKVLSLFEQRFDYQVARGKYGSETKAFEAARGIINAAKELLPFYKPRLAAIAMQAEVEHRCVIRAPEICEGTAELTPGEQWKQLYAPAPDAPAPQNNNIVDQAVATVAKENDDRIARELKQRERDFETQHGRGGRWAEQWALAEARYRKREH
jgi:hypothetical protein